MIWNEEISFDGFQNKIDEWYKDKDFELCDPPVSAQFALDLIFKTLVDDREDYPYLTTMSENVEQTNSIMLDLILRKYSRKYRKSGESVKNTFIKPKMKAWTQEVTAKYPVTDVFGDKRQELNEALDEYLKQKFEPYGIIIDTVNFTSISTDDETQAAIQKKVNAQQELELANIEAKTAKVQADKDKEVALIAAEQEKEKASIQAEQAKIDAEGKAEAIKIKAEAEAEANRKIAESLTPELIEKQKIDKWNGEVPKIQGGNTSTIVDTRDMTADENAE